MANLVEDWEHKAPEGLAVHIRYKDPVSKSNNSALTRETLSWLTHEIGGCFCIEHDRTVENIQYPGGSGNGLILQKNCIIEIQVICQKEKQKGTGRSILKRFLNYYFKEKFTTRIKSGFLNRVNKSYSNSTKLEKKL